jgi:hypothetical protein
LHPHYEHEAQQVAAGCCAFALGERCLLLHLALTAVPIFDAVPLCRVIETVFFVMSASAPAPAAHSDVWYSGPAAFRANAVRSNTQYFFGEKEIRIESGILTRKTEILKWNQIKDLGFSNTCGMRCACNCDAGEITVFAPGDASTGGLYTFYVPSARELFAKMCQKLITQKPELFGEFPAETGLSCCESGGTYKIYSTHIELEHYSRRCVSVCGLFSERKIDFIQLSSITDMNKTETCCAGSFISLFVKDASAILHANTGAAATKAKMDVASYEAVPVEFRLYIHKDHIASVFDYLNKRAGGGASVEAPDGKMKIIASNT